MKGKQQALRFVKEMDRVLLSVNAKNESETIEVQGDDDIATALLLANTDFSNQNDLQERLLVRLSDLEVQVRSVGYQRRSRSVLGRPILLVPAVVAAVLLTLECTWPGGVKGLVIEIVGTFKKMQVGTYTSAELYDSGALSDMAANAPSREGITIFPGPYSRATRSGLNIDVTEGTLRFTTLAPALKALEGFVPKYPRSIPRKWKLGLVLVSEGRNSLHLFYTDRSRSWITLVFEVMHIGEYTQSSGNVRGGLGVGMTANSHTTGRVVSVAGKQMALFTIEMAANDFDNQLVWEEGDQSFILWMEASTVEDVGRIAAQVR